MVAALSEALAHAVMITAFVATMMIAVEYLSVLSRGAFQRALTGARWTQYVAAVALGALPGCLGPFTVVTLYAHGVLPLGAVVGAMIATSGDESFLMLGLFPATAAWLTLGLAATGLVAGPLVDTCLGERWTRQPCPDLVVHPEDASGCFDAGQLLAQWRAASGARLLLTLAIVGYLASVALGVVGPAKWDWIRITLIAVGTFCAFVIATVPEHFLAEHLWRHIVLKHVPRIFMWTFGVLALVAVLASVVDLTGLVRGNAWVVLLVALVFGILPVSGPHLIFVTLFSQGSVPLSILAANSIVQDGHGMLPLLAVSKADFVRIKAINLGVGLVIGVPLLLVGT